MPRVRDLAYRDFRRSIQERMGRPLHAEFELTHRCNLSCIHCYLGTRPGLRPSRRCGKGPELTLEQVKSVVDKLQEAGFIWLVLTGGEPLLRPDFPEIYLYAKARGFIMIILTNATLIDEHIAGLFAAYKPFYLDISLHAVTEDLYERLTGVRGSFGRSMCALALLKKHGIAFKLKTKVMKENFPQLNDIRAFASQRGVPHKVSTLIHRCIDGDIEPLSHRVVAEEKDAPGSGGSGRSGIASRCAAGIFSVCIDPGGRMMACECARIPSYDILSGDALSGIEFLRNHASLRECLLS